MTLKPFRSSTHCPKCHSDEIRRTWNPYMAATDIHPGHPEHLSVVCRCGYSWLEEPASHG